MMLYGPLVVWLGLSFFGPYDVTQGIYSKLLYIHVPTVWVAYLGYTLTFVYFIDYNKMKNHKLTKRFNSVANTLT